MKKSEPTKLLYIGAWIIYAIVGKIMLKGLEYVMEKMELTNMNNIIIFTTAIETVVIIGVFIIIYNLFSTLNMRKVFPWFVGLTLLASLKNMLETIELFAEYNYDPTLFLVALTIEIVVIIYAIRAYYIKKEKRWY